jgi:hypothetical protein
MPSDLPEQNDLIKHKCGKELTRLHMNYIYWVVDHKGSSSEIPLPSDGISYFARVVGRQRALHTENSEICHQSVLIFIFQAVTKY